MANISIGIVGLPNVGKSTLFEALTAVSVPAENYPFCTIDPNVGIVEVPDDRLHRVAATGDPDEVTPAVVEFVDIAGLVEGASRGEGLGNKFLQNIREVDAVAQVLRCFREGSVARVGGGDPLDDLETVRTELCLADLEVVASRLEKLDKRSRVGERGAEAEARVLRRIESRLDAGEPARREPLEPEDRRLLRSLNLLTLKPEMYVLNVDEDAAAGDTPEVERIHDAIRQRDPDAVVVPVSARLEAEIVHLDLDERREYLELVGLRESGLHRLVTAGYRLLGLLTFFTMNDNEARAWTLPVGGTAEEAAGRVHSDFQEHFIRAETIQWDELVASGSLQAARKAGKVRAEGRDYVVRDGDVLLFRTGA
ncbi:MAG: redox-regulated ATPase YchF [Acidobacteriota bacterium]